jgi:hypothetical protein
METIYSLRLSRESGQKLQQLADESFRTRAEVIRYLLHLAIENPYLVLPNIGSMVGDSSTKAMNPNMNTGQGEVRNEQD